MKRTWAAVALFLMFGSASAGFRSGNDLYRLLLSNDPTDTRAAIGYVMAIADAEDYHRLLTVASLTSAGLWKGKLPYRFFCVPDGVTAGQMTDVAKKYLESNPASRHGEAAVLVNAALTDAWPCLYNP